MASLERVERAIVLLDSFSPSIHSRTHARSTERGLQDFSPLQVSNPEAHEIDLALLDHRTLKRNEFRAPTKSFHFAHGFRGPIWEGKLPSLAELPKVFLSGERPIDTVGWELVRESVVVFQLFFKSIQLGLELRRHRLLRRIAVDVA